MLKIKNIELENNVLLAPMAGVTDKAFRLITKPFGPALMYTEMVSGKGLFYNNKRTGDLLTTEDCERPIAVQLFGHEPEVLAEIAYKALESNAEIIDINMGCPVPKIVRNGEGSALMLDPARAEKIVQACVMATDKPITVKTRTGYGIGDFTAVEFCRRMQGAGAAAITLHGRTRALGYAGESDYAQIGTVKNALSVPLFGSGDVTEENAARLIDFCDGLAIGRGAVGDPWIFSRILGREEKGGTKKDALLRHIDLLERYYGERYALVNARKYYGKYISGRKDLKVKLMQADTVAEVRSLVTCGL